MGSPKRFTSCSQYVHILLTVITPESPLFRWIDRVTQNSDNEVWTPYQSVYANIHHAWKQVSNALDHL